MTSISKNLYIDKLDDAVNKCNSTTCRTIKINHVDLKPNMYFDFNKENNERYPKFKVGGNLKISNTKMFLQKSMLQIDQKKCL